MNIGELLTSLRAANPEHLVFYDFCGLVPTTVNSSRGSYDLPALGWDKPSTNPTVWNLIGELEKAIDGRTYHGYKGGEYRFNARSEICVDNYGHWTDTWITGVEERSGCVIITTRSCA